MNSSPFERMPVTREAAKRESYEKLTHGVPDAIYVLGRNIVKNEATGGFRSVSYADKDIHGRVGGGKARSVAAAELAKAFPNVAVVTASVVPQAPESFAKIAAEEITRRGVEADKILLQEESYSTFTELLELVKLVGEKDWHRVSVVLNDFHIPRARAMLDHIHDLHDPNGYWQRPDIQEALTKYREMEDREIVFVSAEEVLLAADPHFKPVIDAARALPEWKETIDVEVEATRQINEGEYWQRKPETFVEKQ